MKKRWNAVIALLLAAAFLLASPLLCACRLLPSAKENGPLTYGQWLDILCERFGLESDTAEPFFAHITKTDPHFASVQACAQWDILLPGERIHTERPLTAGDLAVTLVRAADIPFTRDGASLLVGPRWHSCRAELAAAMDADLLPTWGGFLACGRSVTLQEAEERLSTAVDLWIHLIGEEKLDITYASGVVDLQDADVNDLLAAAYRERTEEEGETYCLQLPADTEPLREGTVYLFRDASGRTESLKVLSVRTQGDALSVTCTTPEIEEVLTEAEIAQTEEGFDFSTVSFVTPDGTVIPVEDLIGEEPGFSLIPTAHAAQDSNAYSVSVGRNAVKVNLEAHPEKGTFAIGLSGKLEGVNKDSAVKLSGKLKFSDFDITGACSYRSGTISGAKLGLSFQRDASVSLEAETKPSKDIADAHGWLGIFRMVEVSDGDLHITIGQLRWGCFYMDIDLTMDIKGKLSYSVSDVYSVGVEYGKNGRRQTVTSEELKQQLSGSVDIEVYFSVAVGLCVMFKIVDIQLELGFGLEVKFAINFMDGSALIRRLEDDAADAYLQEDPGSQEVSDLLVCTELSWYPVAKVEFASEKTLLHRLLKIEWKIDFLPKETHIHPMGHYENGVPVPECTVSSLELRQDQPEPQPEPTSAPVPIDTEHLVEDAYTHTGFYTNPYGGDRIELEYHIPRITVESSSVDALNNEIYNRFCTPELISGIEAAEREGVWPLTWAITYEWYTRDDILTVLVTEHNDAGLDEYGVYCVDLTDRSAMSDADIPASCGLTDAQYRAALENAVSAVVNTPELVEYYQQDPEFGAYVVSSSLSAENLAKARPFRNADGGISVIVPIYAIAGADWYWRILDL